MGISNKLTVSCIFAIISLVADITDGLRVQNPIPPLRLRRCGFLRYKIPADTFMDKIDGDTRNLQLSLRNSSGGELKDNDWIAFDAQNQTLYAILNNYVLETAIVPSIYHFYLVAITKRGESTFDKIQLVLSEERQNTTVAFLVNLVWMAENKPPVAIIQSTFAEKVMKYLGEPPENIRLTHFYQDGLVYATGFANCTANSDPCSSEGSKEVQSMLYTDLGIKTAFRNAMLPEFHLSYIQISKAAKCQSSGAPRAHKHFPTITLTPCSLINYSLPRDVFYDEEDGYNLQLTIYAIDGRKPKNESLWLAIDAGYNRLYGVVTEQAIQGQPNGGYNLTVRAYDSQFQWAETYLILKIAERPIQKYYQFILHFTAIGHSLFIPLLQQTMIVSLINGFFEAKFANIISYEKVNNRQLRVRSSICTLPMKCDEAAFESVWNRMVATGSTPRDDFSSAFAGVFTLTAVTSLKDAICLQELDPPVPVINPWVVPISSCGVFNIQVPSMLFFDKQDGNLGSLLLELFLDNEKVSTLSWLQLNSSNQVLYGLPTHDDINEYQRSGRNRYKLVATDKSGMNGSLDLQFSIQSIYPSTYNYMIVYSQSQTGLFSNSLDELLTFSNKLSTYLGYHVAMGLEKVHYISSTTRRIYYRNCSANFDPCNTQQINEINSRLFVPSINPEFRRAMEPNFRVLLMMATNTTTSCHANTPPRVLHPIPLMKISVCGLLRFSIPAATFCDKEDGLTPNLTLSLSDSKNNSLSQTSWLYWQPEKQIVVFLGTVANAKSQERETFLLTATDKGGLSVQLNLFTSTSGPLDILDQCQIRTKFQIDQSLSGKSNAYLTEKILSTMVTYFGLDSYSQLGLVSVQREAATSIKISWSYCSASYIHYTHSSTAYQTIKNKPDFKGLSLLLRRVFVPGSFHLQSEFKSAFQGVSVVSVIRIFSGGCSSFPPVVGLNQTELIVNAADVGVTKIAVRSHWFYDLEDGDAYYLSLSFMNHMHEAITDLESWVGFDKTSRTILISIADKERVKRLSAATFYLRATDSTGKYIDLPIRVNIIKTSISSPLFYISFYFVNMIRISYQNDSAFIADKISEAYSLGSFAKIKVHSYRVDKGFVDSSVFTWSPTQQMTCSSDILQKAKDHQTSETAFNALKEKFLPRLHLQRAAIRSSCDGPNTQPESQLSSIRLNISMCGIATYKIPHSTFSDAGDGNAKNMRVLLLDSQKRNVSASSWIQLNAATLQLYAIPSRASIPGTSLFYLQAIDSRGLSTEVKVIIDTSEQPYTNDCPVTITFRQKIGPDYIVDLSVLNKMLGVISDFYNDKELKIKVLEFRKLSAYSYVLKYSNCSFHFPSKEAARKGYDINFHITLNELFYRLVKPDGTIQSAFSAFLSGLFDVVSVQINYDCVERPPHATVSRAQSFASTCKEFRAVHSKTMFNDARDGTNLQYSLTYRSGRPLSPSEWITFDERSMEVYGMVTEEVKRKAPSLGYSYLFIATDSSGRSANITYSIRITAPLPYMPIRVILAYSSLINDTTATADALVDISRKIASYMDGALRADEIVISSTNPGKSITFSHCKLRCTEADYMKIASKFQKVTFSSDPSDQFRLAARGSFAPERVYLDGSSCLTTVQIATIVRRVVAFSLQRVCGFVEYGVPDDVFTDNSGKRTKDFILSMDQLGISISSLTTAFDFDSGHQLFYGPIIASQMKRQMIYNLEAKHPQSGLTGLTSFILNAPDIEAYETTSKSLCVISAAVRTTINPSYRDAHIIKKFMDRVARHLGLTLQEIQITSYARDKQDLAALVISFANCNWYSWIRDNQLVSRYTKSRDDAMKMMFVNIQQDSTYHTAFSRALSPDFSLLSLSVNDWCTRPPNKRPVVNRNITVIKVRPCTRFIYQIHESTFSDEDGNTRSLKLQLTTVNGSSLTASDWVSFNTVTQSIYGSPTRQAHISNSGIHRYLLTATDQFGLNVTATVSIEVNGSAPGNKAPTINMKNFKVILPQCGIYRAALPDNFAADAEDGSVKNLHVGMKMLDGSAIPRDSWIQFDHKTHEIYSLVPERIDRSTPLERQYKIIVMDSCGGVETTTITFMTQADKESYYAHTFKFQSIVDNQLPDLDIQIKFLQLVSSYFNEDSRQFRTSSFAKLAGTGNYEYTFANCSTSKYVCPVEVSRYLTAQRIFTQAPNNMNSFATHVSSSFRITSYENLTSYLIKSPPKNISSSSIAIEIKSCGSYGENMSKYFSDEGQLRYEIRFQNGSAIPQSYAIQLSSNRLKIVPLGSESSGTHLVRVTAYDKCNQTAYVDFRVSIDVPVSLPGYKIKFEGVVATVKSTVYYISEFQSALRSHLKDQTYAIEIEQYSHSRNKLEFVWKSCNKVGDRCNKTAMFYLHSHLFTATNLTNRAFLQRLTKTFSNSKLIEYNYHCNFTSYEPPISVGGLDIVTEICKKVDFRVPVGAFSDKEDGNTRQLRLSLFVGNTTQLPYQHWLQFNRLTQTIYGYPRFLSNETMRRDYIYNMIATDIQGNTVSTPVSVQVRGSTEVTYKMTMHGRVKLDNHGPSIDNELLLLHKVGDFFNDAYLNDISFSQNGSLFMFTWSFCRMTAGKCDCHYIKHIETLMAKVDKLKYTMNPEFELINVTSTRDGVCTRQKAPQALMDKREINITAGRAFSHAIHAHHFYDHEDGYTRNLSLYIADSDNVAVTNPYWLKLDNHRLCGLFMLSTIQSSEWASSLSKTYRLVARDACGREVHDSFRAVLNPERANLNFKMSVYVTDSYFDIASNCTKMERFTHLVSSYINVSSSDIFIDNIHQNFTTIDGNSNSSNYTILVWGLQNFTEKNCTNNTTHYYGEKFSHRNGSITRAFHSYMKSDFNVVRVDMNTTTVCGAGVFVPLTQLHTTSEFVLPLWILILLAVLAFLFLFCWLCWICVPRLCPVCPVECIHKDLGCCSSLCGKCCLPGGKYASMEKAAASNVEDGVLSNARTAPEPSLDKAGKEIAPEDIEIAAAAEEDPASSAIEEDEMKLDPEPGPALYAAPDYMKESMEPDDRPDDSYEEPASNYNVIDPDTGPISFTDPDALPFSYAGPDAGPVAPRYTTEYTVPDNGLFGGHVGPEFDDTQMGNAAAAPLPDATIDGLAPMPHEQTQDSEVSGYAQSEDYSSVMSSRHDMEDVLLRPFASDLHGYDYQRSSYSESSYSRHEDEPEIQQTMDILPLSQGMAPLPANMSPPSRKLSLPPMPNVFSDHDTMSQASRASGSQVFSNSRKVSERRMSSANMRRISKDQRRRRASTTQPVVLIVPRESVATLTDDNFDEVNNGAISSRRSKRRRSSNLALLDYDGYDRRESVTDGRNSRGRRMSQVYIQRAEKNIVPARRVSRVHLISSEESLSSIEPIELNMVDRNFSPNVNDYETKESSMDSTRINPLQSQDLYDAEDTVSGRRLHRVRKVSAPLIRIKSTDFADYDDNRGTHAAQRAFSSDRNGSSSQQPVMLLLEDDNPRSLAAITNRRLSTGYESDSTDSGYGMKRNSRRYHLRSQQSLESLGGARTSLGGARTSLGGARTSLGGARTSLGGARTSHGTDDVHMRRSSTTRRQSTSTRLQIGHSQGESMEMWSRDQRNRMLNAGYESDSFV